MSRVGKYPVIVPEGVKVVVEGNLVKASGKLGELSHTFDADHIAVEVNENKVVVTPKLENKHSRALWGTTRANINCIVKGVHEGFSKNLELVGVVTRLVLKAAINWFCLSDFLMMFRLRLLKVLRLAARVLLRLQSLVPISNLLVNLPRKFASSENLSPTKAKA